MNKRVFSRDETCLATQILGSNHAVAEDAFVNRLREMPHNNVCGALTEPSHLNKAYSALQALARLTGQSPGGNPSLGQEDLYFLLAHPERAPDALPLLRTALDLPEKDPEDVALSFGVRPIRKESGEVIEGSQVTFITLTPKNLDPKSVPLVFFDGSRHKSALYLPALIKIARADRRKIIAVDLPGMGGSLLPDDGSVGTSELIWATGSLLNDDTIIPPGQIFDTLSHSLGTIPAREFYFNREALHKNRFVRRLVMIAPVPSQLERSLGYRYYLNSGCYEYRYHSGLDREWLERVTARDPANIHPISIPHGAYLRPFIDRVGREDGIRVVFAMEDCFARLDFLDQWRNRRGIYLVPHAEHSFLAGHEVGRKHLAIVRHALNDPLERSQPILSVDQAYRLAYGGDWFFPDLSFSYRPNFQMAGAGLVSIVGHLGIGAIGRLGFDATIHENVFLGYGRYREEDGLAVTTSIAPYLGVRWLTVPIRAYGGASIAGYGIAKGGTLQGDAVIDGVGGLELEWEALNLRAEYGHTLGLLESDDPLFKGGHSFTLKLGIRTLFITGPLRDLEPW
jgi:pimeloyl-ACP methyl ester carboxylesterase